MSIPGKSWLIGAGALSAFIAVLHVVIIAVGPRAYAYFGAGDLAPLAASGSPVPALITTGLVLVFGVWSWYAFAGAGRVRTPPLLWPGVWAIGAIYALRGLALLPEVVAVWAGSTSTPARYPVFSLVSLVTGIAYLAGAWSERRERHARPSSAIPG